MMTQEYFEALKADMLTTYAVDLCEESVADIKAANNVMAFIAILNKYTAFLNYKCIPEIDWVRKWFGNYKRDAEDCGCYIDCVRFVTNPALPITLYGTANVTLIVSEPHIYQVTTQDESHLQINAVGEAVVNVRQKQQSEVKVLDQSKTSIIKIRKV